MKVAIDLEVTGDHWSGTVRTDGPDGAPTTFHGRLELLRTLEALADTTTGGPDPHDRRSTT
ncbi:hypothetical protein PO878_03100 [Iamia majanohamensis]|uniref:Uncharacterized protein n=1 Tax=Iamia majanohamensis TaxID=467976 RepID=A0AAE9Y6Q2_9ACTN|nr:hypothetical protein [Iamia majanohamensis]WCO67710.1 hypothetical protein PO878_03100 [Iamia majanohamensis]